MPILEVEIVLEPGEELKPGLAAELANTAAEIFQSGPEQTWLRLRPLPQANYAENGGTAKNVKPVFVSILKSQQPTRAQKQKEAHQLAERFAQVCGRPAEHVHILYLPEGNGRVAFGGQLLVPEDQ